MPICAAGLGPRLAAWCNNALSWSRSLTRTRRTTGELRPLSLLEQAAANYRGRELPGQAVVQPLQGTNRRQAVIPQLEPAVSHASLEPRDGHLIQAAFDLRELRRPVVANVLAPAQQSLLREDEMGPGEYGKQVSAERVIPGGSETDQHRAARRQQAVHDFQ